MNNIIAVGPREQDFAHTNDFFSGSITLYGRNQGENRSYAGSCQYRINHNVFTEEQAEFVESEMLKKISQDPDIRFMSYDPNQAYDCGEEIVRRTVCLNGKALMDKLNHKITFREWAEDVCRVHRSHLLAGKICTYHNLRQEYGNYAAFVVQENFATGGEGTFILTEQNADEIERKIHKEEEYLVSGYEYYNVPLNIHAVVYEEDFMLFPASIQIMQRHNNKLLYQGADFIEAMHVDQNAMEEFREYARNICVKLQKEGFRGITGIDGMIVDGKAYILEMNNRFQGSTSLLNLALKDAGLPSMQELNYDSFQKSISEYIVDNLNVPYSCFVYLADGDGQPYSGHKRDWTREKNIVGVYDDGLNYEWGIAPNATLERVIFDTNIVSVNDENRVVLHPNIPDMNEKWYEEIVQKHNLLYLKIALINQGVILSQDTKRYLEDHGGMREGVYNAVDIFMKDIVVNSAIRVKFTKMSPFEIKISSDGLVLYCCDMAVADVVIQPADVLGEKMTSSGTKVKDICLFATDRVRVQHATNCHFKRCEVGCDFCEVDNHEFAFEMRDILEGIDLYIDSEYDFRHFLIGGRTEKPSQEAQKILEIAEHIHKRGNWPIYVMCIPPREKSILAQFYDAGITELALNIEIWNPDLARKWMPGKGAIPRENYLEMLEYATGLWGKQGAVRTSFIVGLESRESLMEGIRAVCAIGVAPILSVFRPIPGTKGEYIVPPANEELLCIYTQAKSICKEYGLELGPSCVPCQNNTLSLPHELM